ncbi:kinesin-like protein KIF16B [Choristoneura fumiferana]|uniref:kinesin-like protein KIF16B n=1 Tax=Choristoneura fumiferana TaxID=7141 RepID=UPI003D15B92B
MRSFLEIYNERVHDLLVGEDPPLPFNSLPRRRGNARKDLRVRQHPTKGPYVQNLRRVAVNDVETLLALVSEGGRRRRTAATRRNTSSSRSHALLELSTPKATLHLADLAGSEKASWEGCCGGRQKEGANINKSLVALSNVISALDHEYIRLTVGHRLLSDEGLSFPRRHSVDKELHRSH